MWIAGIFGVLWLDAVVVVLALGVEQGSWFWWYRVAGVAWTLVFLGVASYRGKGWIALTLGVAAFWAWTSVLPRIPWSESKRVAQDVRRLIGQPVDVAQEVMSDYEVEIFTYREPTAEELDWDIPGPFSGRVSEGQMGDVDLGSIDVADIRSYDGFLGGWDLFVSRGIVTGACFQYD